VFGKGFEFIYLCFQKSMYTSCLLFCLTQDFVSNVFRINSLLVDVL
jgi:hypothetical protein